MRPRLAILVFALGTLGCRGGSPPPAVVGPKSPSGWEIRYNAALALAHRGSAKTQEPAVWDMILEMLDERQQMNNFAIRLNDGREVPDETAARLTVIGALRAVQALHRQQPTLDYRSLEEPIARLSESPNVPVRTEARAAQLTLFKQ